MKTDLDSMITTFNTAVTETASKLLDKHRPKKKPWVTAEILDLCDRSRKLRKKRFGPEGSERYREGNNNIKSSTKKAKENWIGELCSEFEKHLRKNNRKRAYQLAKDLTTVKKGKATTVQDRSGKCLTEERKILNRWAEYCTELYNHKTNGDTSVLDCPQTDTEDDHSILRKEVETVVQSLKRGKSAGVDNIPAELIQADGGCNHLSHVSLSSKLELKQLWRSGQTLQH